MTALEDRQEGGSIVNTVHTWRTQTLLSPDDQYSVWRAQQLYCVHSDQGSPDIHLSAPSSTASKTTSGWVWPTQRVASLAWTMSETTFNMLEISCIFLFKAFTSPVILHPHHYTALKMAKQLMPLTNDALHHGWSQACHPCLQLLYACSFSFSLICRVSKMLLAQHLRASVLNQVIY